MLGIIVRRSLLLLGLTLLTGSVLVPQSSLAVDVDKGLKDLLKDKSVELIPVVMIYHEPVTIGDLTFELDRLTPEKRRKSALQALKRKNRKVQQDALNLLEDPGMSDHVKNVRHLYMAGAISFQASREAVESLAGLADNATLFYNQGFDMTAATSRGPRPGEKVLTDRADTTWNIKWIDADRVWNELGYTGAGVLVGHIDSGVLVSHSDLVNQLYVNVAEVPGNGIDDDMNGYVDDWRGWDFGLADNNPNDDGGSPGHGTHTAGTVAGDGTGGTHTGVAPGAKILGCKVADAAGSMTLGAIWEAQQYCAENGARIITMSLGIPGEVPASYMRTERVIADNLRNLGVTFFNSAGNNNYDADEPPIELGMTARVPSPWTVAGTAYSNTGGVITVGGTGYRNDAMYGSSSRGPAKWDDVDPYNDWPYLPGPGLIKPDVSAPGVNINSTTVFGGYSGETWSGTSMSTPLVAGVAALMLEKNPSLSPAGIDSLMQLNSIDFGTAGKDNNYGAGRLDAYATLMATPETILADLHQSRVLPDPSGDGVLDPGENSTMAFEITNASPYADGMGITGKLAVVSNPYVTVIDEDGIFTDADMNGGVGDNANEPFGLAVAAGAPQGYEFTMLLTVETAAGFSRTFDLPWYVGLPEFRTHDKGGIYLTVTDQGSIGFMSDEGTFGEGMGLTGEGNGLFVGSFWAGLNADYICNRDYAGASGGIENYEWEVVTDPNGRVKDLSASSTEQTYSAIFSDSGHPLPKPLTVTQNSYAYADGPDNQFVIMEYTLTNGSSSSIFNLYTGIFCDFDVSNSGANVGGSDDTHNVTYINAGVGGAGPYFGIALLGDPGAAANLSLINNPLYVYDTSSIEDSIKMRHLRGLMSEPSSDTPDDWSALTSAAVDLSGNGGQATVAYAMVVGTDLDDLLANVEAANAAYSPTSPVEGETPRKLVKLAQNHPNPFNPSTNIKFSVAREGHVELGVYDLSGRKVRTLVNEARDQGDYTVTWDGKDEAGSQMPSGLYFYRMNAGGKTISKKMTLVK